ncbi:hypothetical protein K440DRAFT_651641 [Wilcoxina mikolae CBS 423.85]|nr:hypothetical protein K440DRAFT_651641 [Wilcoxina mikolae CBS 423.85]
MFYLLPLTQTIALENKFKAHGIYVFQFALLDLNPSSVADNNSVNLMDSGDFLLHISIRREAGVIVFNTVDLLGRFVGPTTTITIYVHGDRYHILCDYHTVHYYNKRIKKNATSVAYLIGPNQTSPFSTPLAVTTYNSMGNRVSGSG